MKSWPVLGITMMITVAMVTGDIQEDNGATSLSRLGILLEAQRLLQTLKEEYREPLNYNHQQPHTYETAMLVRTKKGSVSWLLAAAIRMCRKYPNHCLRPRDTGADMVI